MPYTEADYEKAIIQLFEEMGYTHIYGPDIEREYKIPLYMDELTAALYRLNPKLPDDAINDAIYKLTNFENGELVQKNAVFMDYLQNGITVKFFIKGEERSSIVRLIDYNKVENNSFYVVNQFTFLENGNNRRPDIILFINGLPLVLMELKSPSKDEVGAENAFNQIRNYMQDIPSMFYYNAICVISDLSTNKAGTITAGFDRFDGHSVPRRESVSGKEFPRLFQCMQLRDALHGTSSFQRFAKASRYYLFRLICRGLRPGSL